MSKEFVKDVILQAIEKVSGIKVTDENRLFFNFEWNISPGDVIYIIDEIEKNLSRDVATIVAECDYKILCVNSLVEAICSVDN